MSGDNIAAYDYAKSGQSSPVTLGTQFNLHLLIWSWGIVVPFQVCDPVKLCKPPGAILPLQSHLNNKPCFYGTVSLLRMFAGYNYLFNLFFLHLFFASKIYSKTFNTKIAIDYCAFFQDTGFWMDSSYKILEIYRSSLNFHSLYSYLSWTKIYHECFQRHFIPLW